MDAVQVRLMRVDDLQSAEGASAVTFFEADRRSRRVSEPEIKPRSEAASKRWIDRMRFFLTVDPQGCWVVANGDEIIGFAISQNRGPFWYLATYGVLTEHQGPGILSCQYGLPAFAYGLESCKAPNLTLLAR